MSDAVAKKVPDGIARHPEYFNHRVHPDMKLPADTRKLRDIKIKEVPTWLMKRDWSPIGLLFSTKRWKNRVHTKYLAVRNPGGNLFFIGAFWLGALSYLCNLDVLRREKLRKYH